MNLRAPRTRHSAGRNDPCHCGSGLKYKDCCSKKDSAIASQQGFARAQFQRGVELERRGRDDEAIEAYRLALALLPTMSEANSRLGHLLLARGRITDACNAFRAAAAVNPDSTGCRMDLVRALMAEGRNSEAEADLRRALDGDPTCGDGHWLLGRLLTEFGRFVEARAALEQAVALNPKQGAAYYDLVRSFTLTETDRPLINRMLALARTLNSADQRIRLHLGLGKAFEDIKEYGAAMIHFTEANRIKNTLGRFDRAAFARRIDNLIDRFTLSFLAAHVKQDHDTRLPVLIVGMPRSGTTLVEQILSSHREIVGAGELQFWAGRDLMFSKIAGDSAISEFQRQAARDYVAILRGIAPEAARVTDKNPFNFLCVGLIHLVFPCASIIHCRRNPIDTCLSVFSTYFGRRSDFSTDRDDLVFYYRQYSRLMAHWRAIVPPERFIEVDYEALVADPETVSRRLVAVCGVSWDPACLQPERNKRVVRSASKWQARQPVHGAAVERWRRYEPWIGSLLELGSAPSG